MFTLLKEMNIFLSWKALKTLWQRKEQFLPLSQCYLMSSAADVKNGYLWSKGLTVQVINH